MEVEIYTSYQTLSLSNYNITQIRTQSKIHFDLMYYFLIHLKLERQIRSYTPVVPIPFGTAHTVNFDYKPWVYTTS